MKLAASQELHAYWSGLRGARSAPERAEIDPAAIRGVLADTFILELDESRGYPIRIAGTRTNLLFDRELKGAAFVDLWRKPDQLEIAAVLACVADEAVAVVAGASSRREGGEPMDLELLLLPLRHRGATHARALGAISPASLPSWFGLLPAAALSLLSLRIIEPGEPPSREPRATAGDGAPGAVGFGRPPALARRGHLFVVPGAADLG
ncbi:MAG: PAS domain-containing protein [Roseiarcus sp.]